MSLISSGARKFRDVSGSAHLPLDKANCLMFLDQLAKLFEQNRRVVRTWGSLWMILDAEDRFLFVPHAFESVVIEVDAINFNVAGQ